MRIKRVLQYILVNDVSWWLAKPFVYAASRLSASRKDFINRDTDKENEATCAAIFGSKKVLHGIFKGLDMGSVQPTGSSLYAKLLGSYELEIIPVVEKLLQKKPGYLFNIGSDEGYYAVGIAKLQPAIKVIAFDCNKKAQAACNTLAALNTVQNVVTRGCFKKEELPQLTVTESGLFIIDCEGCEDTIITPELVQEYAGADFIIELHFATNPLLAQKLQALFAGTHAVQLINALSDHERVMQYDYPELQGLNYEQKKYILNERDVYMQWLIATPL